MSNGQVNFRRPPSSNHLEVLIFTNHIRISDRQKPSLTSQSLPNPNIPRRSRQDKYVKVQYIDSLAQAHSSFLALQQSRDMTERSHSIFSRNSGTSMTSKVNSYAHHSERATTAGKHPLPLQPTSAQTMRPPPDETEQSETF